MGEFDELKIETIAAAHYYDDANHCLDEATNTVEFAEPILRGPGIITGIIQAAGA
jgi:hypothetical protein